MEKANNSDPEVLARAREQLSKMTIINVEGVPYNAFGMEDHLSDSIAFIKNLQLRPTDIINIGFPRTGNHWMFEIVSMLTNNNANYEEEPFIWRILEFQPDGVSGKEKSISALADPRVIVTHCRATKAPKQIVEKCVKVVYILRNPKDSMWSWFRLFSSYVDGVRWPGTWEEFFEASLVGEIPWGSWFDHVLDMETFTKDHPSVPVFIAQYEKFKTEPEAEIRKLAQFLGQPEDKVSEIAMATDFKTMKAGTRSKVALIEEKWLQQSTDGILVKGVVGDWKKHFTVDMNERFDREFEARMKESKIADMVRKYIQT